jgi:hypothetical protein
VSAPSSDRAGIRQAIRAVRAAGWELSSVWDGEEVLAVRTEDEAIEAVTAVDSATLNLTRDSDAGSILFVLGNDPEEVVCNYTTNLDPWIDRLIDSWI